MSISGYRAMWVLVMFDLPVKSKPQKKAASGFRKDLIQDGFNMVQYSVYSRPCPSEENASVHVQHIKKALPSDGEVRILRFTDKQYARIECYLSTNSAALETQPSQIDMF